MVVESILRDQIASVFFLELSISDYFFIHVPKELEDLLTNVLLADIAVKMATPHFGQ